MPKKTSIAHHPPLERPGGDAQSVLILLRVNSDELNLRARGSYKKNTANLSPPMTYTSAATIPRPTSATAISAPGIEGARGEIEVADQGGAVEGDKGLCIGGEEHGLDAREGRGGSKEDKEREKGGGEGDGEDAQGLAALRGAQGVLRHGGQAEEVRDGERGEEGRSLCGSVDEGRKDEGLALRARDDTLEDGFGGGVCNHGIGPEHMHADEQEGGAPPPRTHSTVLNSSHGPKSQRPGCVSGTRQLNANYAMNALKDAAAASTPDVGCCIYGVVHQAPRRRSRQGVGFGVLANLLEVRNFQCSYSLSMETRSQGSVFFRKGLVVFHLKLSTASSKQLQGVEIKAKNAAKRHPQGHHRQKASGWTTEGSEQEAAEGGAMA
ncbi:hypothetical protein B0H11DRAFT_2207764 [Mycena galericulata]|nr:hypothetical protein B0H11DRAFT_2207764 [Mycena galericulata]